MRIEFPAGHFDARYIVWRDDEDAHPHFRGPDYCATLTIAAGGSNWQDYLTREDVEKLRDALTRALDATPFDPPQAA